MSVCWKSLLSGCGLLLVFAGLAFAGNDVKPEDLLAHHLDSIGTREVRNGVKSRVVEGAATYKLLVGGSGAIEGKSVFASEGQKAHILLKVAAQQYHGRHHGHRIVPVHLPRQRRRERRAAQQRHPAPPDHLTKCYNSDGK